MQSLKTKVAAEKAAQGALEENDGARRKLRKAVAARDAAYGMDDAAEALLLRALDAFADARAGRGAKPTPKVRENEVAASVHFVVIIIVTIISSDFFGSAVPRNALLW